MATVVGGQGTGILDTSLFLLNRGDQTGNANSTHGDAIFINVSNGNLVIQQTDMYLPSQGEDSLLTRTYNARGVPNDTQQGNGTRWSGTPTTQAAITVGWSWRAASTSEADTRNPLCLIRSALRST